VLIDYLGDCVHPVSTLSRESTSLQRGLLRVRGASWICDRRKSGSRGNALLYRGGHAILNLITW
jgi:hypothetical protein